MIKALSSSGQDSTLSMWQHGFDSRQGYMDKLTDEQLIKLATKENKVALETLVARYLKLIYVFICHYVRNREDAEDITQEVFVKMWRNLRKFNPQKGPALCRTAGSGAGFKTWLFSIAKNTAIDWLRKSRSAFGGKKALPFSAFEDDKGDNALIEKLNDLAPLPNEIIEQKDAINLLKTALGRLSLKYREVLSLHYNNQFTFREIAESLDEPLDTVKSRHHRALIFLRKLISE